VRRSSLVLLAVLASVFGIVSGLFNLYHWWNIGWDGTSYHEMVPVLGILSWFIIIVVYRYEEVDNPGLWLFPVFWLVYCVIQFGMVYGLIA